MEARDAPLPVAVAPVFLVVVPVAAQSDAGAVGPGRELNVVLHRPDAARGVGPGQLDLGHVTVVHGGRALQCGAHLVHDRGAAVDDHARLGNLHVAVEGEHEPPLVPVLGVHVTEVAGLARPDGLVVEQRVERIGGHGGPFEIQASISGCFGVGSAMSNSTVASRRAKWMSSGPASATRIRTAP